MGRAGRGGEKEVEGGGEVESKIGREGSRRGGRGGLVCVREGERCGRVKGRRYLM